MLSQILLTLAAFFAGMLNAVAGGGAFIAFPALIFAGMPALNANASSTVALFPGQFASAFAYRSDIRGIEEFSITMFLVLSLIGGLLGALLLLVTPAEIFKQLVPWLLLFATVVFVVGNFAPASETKRFRLSRRAVLVVQFVIACYGGYFGGGIGFLMLAALTLFGMRDIHAMNGIKILMGTMMNATAVVTFIVAGIVYWPQTASMAVASFIGGYAGVVVAKRVNQKLLKGFVALVATAMTIYFFWRGA
ncbi:MAG: hypothetical protein JWL84_4040 [Rhodospirillales bacterium]|nr:hypothetical protein [Rhodospirillales bacterium]